MIQDSIGYIKQGQPKPPIYTQNFQEYSVFRLLLETIINSPPHAPLQNEVIKNLMTPPQESNLRKEKTQKQLLNGNEYVSQFISYINFCSLLDIYIKWTTNEELKFALLVVSIEGFNAVNKNLNCPVRKQLHSLIKRKFNEILAIDHGMIASIDDEEFHIIYEYNDVSQVVNFAQIILNNLKPKINLDDKVFFSQLESVLHVVPRMEQTELQ